MTPKSTSLTRRAPTSYMPPRRNRPFPARNISPMPVMPLECSLPVMVAARSNWKVSTRSKTATLRSLYIESSGKPSAPRFVMLWPPPTHRG